MRPGRAILLALVLGLAACGIKGDPVPPEGAARMFEG